ncbi:MAG TPA: WbqC family protein [Hanamia sp.]|nr:WbqC family protein [Hanamia sp.]
MRLGIMQPYLFPYLGYFQLINVVDKFIFYDDVNFIKQGWINRNKILLNGNEFLFTLPLEKGSSFKLISETEINKKLFENWKIKFNKTLLQAYCKAPYFETVHALILDALEIQTLIISDLACESINLVCDYLGIKTKCVKSSEQDYNNDILKASDRVIDICIKESANDYFNPIGGKELYTKEEFLLKGLELHFICSRLKPYKQFDNDHIPSLSIIDVMMFNPKDEILKMLDNYEIV